MGLTRVTRSALCLLLLIAAAVAVAACNDDPSTPEPIAASVLPIVASVLIEADAASPQWFRDVTVPKGIDGYELLKEVAEGDIAADWFPEFRAHFVKEVLGVAPEGSEFWGVFVWNENANDKAGGWEPLPVGADLFSVKDGHIMGWALVEFDPDQPQLPVSLPSPAP